MLTEEQFNELTADIPEDGFRRVVPLLYQSFEKKRGRTLDRQQVAALAVGLMEMSGTIDNQITYIGELQKELEEAQEKKKLWRP